MSQAVVAIACPKCAAPLPRTMLMCPSCRALVYGERLNWLAQSAEITEKRGDVAGALSAWRSALVLLPPGTRQHEQVVARIEALTAQLDAQGEAPAPPKRGRAGPLAGIATVALVVLSKLKFLLLGLTKLPTLLGIFSTLAIYWRLYGWMWAVLFLATIYVHELGHVVAFGRLGIPATAPMFLPGGVGAFVRGRHAPASPREQAYVSLAGPWWGGGAAAICAAIGLFGHAPVWLAVGHTAAWLNLLNLIPLDLGPGVPLGRLDGGGAFTAFAKRERLFMFALALAAALLSWNLLPLLVAAGALWQALWKPAPAESDRRALASYAAILVLLTLSFALPTEPLP